MYTFPLKSHQKDWGSTSVNPQHLIYKPSQDQPIHHGAWIKMLMFLAYLIQRFSRSLQHMSQWCAMEGRDSVSNQVRPHFFLTQSWPPSCVPPKVLEGNQCKPEYLCHQRKLFFSFFFFCLFVNNSKTRFNSQPCCIQCSFGIHLKPCIQNNIVMNSVIKRCVYYCYNHYYHLLLFFLFQT